MWLPKLLLLAAHDVTSCDVTSRDVTSGDVTSGNVTPCDVSSHRLHSTTLCHDHSSNSRGCYIIWCDIQQHVTIDQATPISQMRACRLPDTESFVSSRHHLTDQTVSKCHTTKLSGVMPDHIYTLHSMVHRANTSYTKSYLFSTSETKSHTLIDSYSLKTHHIKLVHVTVCIM